MKFRVSPPQKVVIGYIVIIAAGTLLLSLPWSRHTAVSFTDAVFTATSALCVTGLTTVTTSSTWTPLGVIVIAALMQIGGAGFTMLTTGLYLAVGRKVTLRNRILIAEDRNFGIQGAVRLVRSILLFSFTIEGVAALMFMFYFHAVYHYSWVKAMGFSVFQSISAFNNAGFDLWGNSLEGFKNDPFVLLLTSALIILGGLGFIVLTEIYSYAKTRKFSLHAQIVLRMTVALLVLPTIIFYFMESNYSFVHMSFGSKLLNAWFTSVTTRTAGFDSIQISRMNDATWLVIILLMFIGASPGSTGGGIKTTTFFTLIKATITSIRGNEEVAAFGRSISWQAVQRSLMLFFLATTAVLIASILDAILDPGISLIRLLFEETSAFGTVGLSTGITGTVNTAVKWVLICTMYIGRVGLLTILIGMLYRSGKTSRVKRVQERIFIG